MCDALILISLMIDMMPLNRLCTASITDGAQTNF